MNEHEKRRFKKERAKVETALDLIYDLMKEVRDDAIVYSEVIELSRDEFLRIKACPSASSEIIGLCERALSNITAIEKTISYYGKWKRQ